LFYWYIVFTCIYCAWCVNLNANCEIGNVFQAPVQLIRSCENFDNKDILQWDVSWWTFYVMWSVPQAAVWFTYYYTYEHLTFNFRNMFLWHVAPASIIFVTFTVLVAIFLFHSPKPLLQHSLLVGLITATLFFIILHLSIF